MQKHLDLLGWKVRDKVSGYTGIVEHVGVDLYGCVQAIVKPAVVVDEKSGEQKTADGRWHDVARLEKIGDSRVMEPIRPRDVLPPGPADKPTK